MTDIKTKGTNDHENVKTINAYAEGSALRGGDNKP